MSELYARLLFVSQEVACRPHNVYTDEGKKMARIDPSTKPRTEKVECVWRQVEDGVWETGCGKSPVYEHMWAFCPYCRLMMVESSAIQQNAEDSSRSESKL